jgi:regulator of protease activity HflC (stomatin/prohibitin superfamily)
MRSDVKLAGMIGAALLAAILVFTSFFTVGQNELTVVNRFGEFRYVAEPGLHFKVPLIDGTQAYRTDIRAMSPEKGVNTDTIDNQEVDVVYTVFYRVPADRVAYIFTNNRDYESRLAALTVDRLKAAMGQVNVQSVAEKRGELRDTIKATLDRDVKVLGLEITDFQLTDMQYTDAFRQAVNNAAVQKANIESVEYQRQQAQKQAETARIKAEGDANARLLQAQAEAKAIALQGEAQASAIRAQADALKSNPTLIDLRKAERWDGKLPAAIYAGAPIPFLSVDKSTEAPVAATAATAPPR